MNKKKMAGIAIAVVAGVGVLTLIYKALTKDSEEFDFEDEEFEYEEE